MDMEWNAGVELVCERGRGNSCVGMCVTKS